MWKLKSLGNCKFGKKSKTIKINYNELKHQDMLIKWLVKQNDILSYQTEKELKREAYLEKNEWGNRDLKKGYPDLLVHYEDKEMIIELERTCKSKENFEDKIDGLRSYLRNGLDVLWLVPNQKMLKFIYEQILEYNWKLEQQHIQIVINT
ncbi:hypothetical protein [Spiroplasma endosymbiont of Zeiraphera isertana]|uniref:hypothetical protein n=1 Tax=Spiroplasma endosymbiont of Zeiraphera isertana TaxID=3066313 RepID=UPI00313ED623